MKRKGRVKKGRTEEKMGRRKNFWEEMNKERDGNIEEKEEESKEEGKEGGKEESKEVSKKLMERIWDDRRD